MPASLCLSFNALTGPGAFLTTIYIPPTSVCHLEMRRCGLGTQALLDQVQVEALLVLQGAEHERTDCRERHST